MKGERAQVYKWVWREIDREGETGYGEIEEREQELENMVERERERAY